MERRDERRGSAPKARRARRSIVLALIVAAGLLGAFALGSSWADIGEPRDQPSANTAAKIEAQRDARSLEWIELYTGGAKEGEALPLVLALHGLGDRPEYFAYVFEGLRAKARVIIPRAPIPYSGGFGWTLVRASGGDRSALASELNARALELEALLRGEREKKKETVGAPIVIGFSQGAMLTYLLAVQPSPEIHAAIPIAGLLVDEALLPARAPKDAPAIHAFHGDADPLIPFSEGERTTEWLKARGYEASLHRGRGVPHRIPGEYRAEVLRTLERAIAEVTRAGAPER